MNWRTWFVLGSGGCLGLILAVHAASVARADEADDVATLLRDVHQIPVVGTPGAIIPFGPQAFPLVVGNAGKTNVVPVVAAARLGKGRIVAFAHNGYFSSPSTGDWRRLLLNAVAWSAAGRQAPQSDPRVVVYAQDHLLEVLRAGAVRGVAADAETWRSLLNRCDVLCIDTDFEDQPELVEPVRRFVEEGGGLVTAGTGWGWVSLHPGKRLADDYLGNRVLRPAGLVVSNLNPRGTDKRFDIVQPPSKLASAWQALAYLRAASKREGREPPRLGPGRQESRSGHRGTAER